MDNYETLAYYCIKSYWEFKKKFYKFKSLVEGFEHHEKIKYYKEDLSIIYNFYNTTFHVEYKGESYYLPTTEKWFDNVIYNINYYDDEKYPLYMERHKKWLMNNTETIDVVLDNFDEFFKQVYIDLVHEYNSVLSKEHLISTVIRHFSYDSCINVLQSAWADLQIDLKGILTEFKDKFDELLKLDLSKDEIKYETDNFKFAFYPKEQKISLYYPDEYIPPFNNFNDLKNYLNDLIVDNKRDRVLNIAMLLKKFVFEFNNFYEFVENEDKDYRTHLKLDNLVNEISKRVYNDQELKYVIEKLNEKI